MDLNDLGDKLQQTYAEAIRGEKVTRVLLFGINNRDAIRKHSIRDIVKKAGIPKNYATELLKAVKLGEYIDLKENIS